MQRRIQRQKVDRERKQAKLAEAERQKEALQAKEETPDHPGCESGYVTVLAGETYCEFWLKEDGSLDYRGKWIARPLISSPSFVWAGKIPAEKLILLPPSPSGRYRIIQLCARHDCTVFIFDSHRNIVKKVPGGHGGLQNWIKWSDDDAYAILWKRNDDLDWLYFYDTNKLNYFHPFPKGNGDRSVIIDTSTFSWVNNRELNHYRLTPVGFSPCCSIY